MPYNVSVEANESRGVLLSSASRNNLVIVGKLPSLWDSRPAIRFDTDWQTQRGHFAMSKWQRKVYHAENADSETTGDEWKIIRDEVIRRDNFRCIRCDEQLPMKSLTVHHMIPRCKGGGSNTENLISLCRYCHDIVESNGLQTRADIIGSTSNEIDRFETRGRQTSDWHAWVYGGMKSLKRGRKS